jgi:hypothetical protein
LNPSHECMHVSRTFSAFLQLASFSLSSRADSALDVAFVSSVDSSLIHVSCGYACACLCTCTPRACYGGSNPDVQTRAYRVNQTEDEDSRQQTQPQTPASMDMYNLVHFLLGFGRLRIDLWLQLLDHIGSLRCLGDHLRRPCTKCGSWGTGSV